MIRLDIYSDPICPWCYIGRARLMQALAQRSGHPFEISWLPFQLNLGMPRGGMDRRAYLESKFGGQKGAVDAYLPVVEEAGKSGLALNLEAIQRTPNTVDAHRLIHWAEIEGRQDDVVERLFRAYFVEGRDIGDEGVLGAIAGEAGMDTDVTARLLASDADRGEIMARDKDARERGVRAVPTFVVANQHVVPGAQPIGLWLRVIDELAGREEQEEPGPA